MTSNPKLIWYVSHPGSSYPPEIISGSIKQINIPPKFLIGDKVWAAIE